MDAQDTDLKTVNYVESLPENVRVELIDGVVYDMDIPTTTHQKIVAQMCWIIETYIREQNSDSEVYLAPFAVYLNNDEWTYVEPDVSVICDRDKLDDKGCHGAPDWIIEVFSLSSGWRDCVIKLIKYREAGVREYWIINPDAREVNVHYFEEATNMLYSFDDAIPVGIYPGFSIRISDIITE